MALRKFKPTTPGQRHKVAITFEEITTSRPEKSLLVKKKSSGGRNDTGKMTIANIGGGHKQRYRIIDFKRNKFDILGEVVRKEYDPNRSPRIALVQYEDGEKRYIIAPEGLKVGDKIISSKVNQIPFKTGNAMPLGRIPEGLLVHNIELKPSKGAQMVRSAGAYARIMATEKGMVTLKLPSGELRIVSEGCIATIGTVGNKSHENIIITFCLSFLLNQ